jgi:hypothetical protein
VTASENLNFKNHRKNPRRPPQKKQPQYFFPIFTEKYILEEPKNYTFLTSGFVTVQNQDDAEEFAATMEAMRIMVIKPKF